MQNANVTASEKYLNKVWKMCVVIITLQLTK